MSWRSALARLGGALRRGSPTPAPRGPAGPSTAAAARSADASPSAAALHGARATPTTDVLIGGRYRLERELGRGATGSVHLAVDVRTHQAVAVKLMPAAPHPPRATATPEEASAREWRAAQRLRHPGIVPLLDAGGDRHLRWTASELAAGVDLQRYTHPNRLLPEAMVLRVGAQLLSALAHAHAHGVVHRDVKPSNVLLELPLGRARIVDFGVARIDDGSRTATGMTFGTPAYMSPEQLAGAPADAASDAYAVGVILFELFAGRRPHEAATLGELLRSVGAGQAASLAALRPGLDAAVVDAVHALLATDPRQRPAALEAFASRLRALADRLHRAAGDAA